MKKLILLLAILTPFSAFGQRTITPTDNLTISGKIKNELKFTLADLDTFPVQAISDLVITNQKGEIKSTIHNLKGFLLKDILGKLEIPVEKPKELNEFYFLFIASDGYKVVFSYNEIFNSEVGDHLYLVTEKEGKKLGEMEERIVVVSASDLKVGPRYIKGLEQIVVERVD